MTVALTGGRWVRGAGGIRRWVPSDPTPELKGRMITLKCTSRKEDKR